MTDTSTPKRRGRPRVHENADARRRASETARGMGQVRVPGHALAILDALAEAHGDPSRTAVVTRLAEEEAKRMDTG